MDAAKREKLEQTTRYEPGEIESRVFAEWMGGGYFHPEATGASRSLLPTTRRPPDRAAVVQ